MKPHFGQSDAAMNKLAGLNILPNNNKTADLSKLRNVHCYCIPCKHYEVSLDHGPCVSCRDHAKFEEKDFDPVKERDAAYDLGYNDGIKAGLVRAAEIAANYQQEAQEYREALEAIVKKRDSLMDDAKVMAVEMITQHNCTLCPDASTTCLIDDGEQWCNYYKNESCEYYGKCNCSVCTVARKYIK